MGECFQGKKILLGMTGGIAAYKVADLCRQLSKQGAEIRVIMTRGACEFITPLTMQALSGNQVHTELLDPSAELGMGHIELAKWPDLVLIAPATANFIAKYNQGLADDLLTTVLLATQAPVSIAPAMNQAMWLHPITQYNINSLKQKMGSNLFFMGPAEGVQACGDNGPGRLLEPSQLVDSLHEVLNWLVNEEANTDKLLGKRVLITAGPTREAIDPVRFISNHSSGKMGYALAEACAKQGALVTVITGPCQQPKISGIEYVDVQSALDMHAMVHQSLDAGIDIFIGCAAVADYRPVNVAHQKIKKCQQDSAEMLIRLEENPDIIASVAARLDRPFTVGFAAETQNVIAYAQDKLQRKKLDMIVANDVSKVGQGFNSDMNQVTLISAETQIDLAHDTKRNIAHSIIEHIANVYQIKHRKS